MDQRNRAAAGSRQHGYVRWAWMAFCLVLSLASLPLRAQSASETGAEKSVEDVLLGTWLVMEREFGFDDVVVRQIDGKVHVTERNPDGSYTVLVTLSSHFGKKEGAEGTIPECDFKEECVLASATEAIGIYSNGRFRIDYLGENWYDDVFTLSGLTMRGRDPNGPIVLEKDEAGRQ